MIYTPNVYINFLIMLRKLKDIIYSAGLLLGKIRYNNRNSKVLYYHDVHRDNTKPETLISTPMSLFSEHIRIIKEQGFEIVDRITEPENQIMLTFDDGYLGIYKNKDFFINRGLKPTVFLISNSIGTDTFIDEQEILSLQKEGFRFQSHTHTHPLLNKLNIKELKEEFSTSKNILENLLSKEVDGICFPEGMFNPEVVETARACGYKYLYSSIPGMYYEDNKFGVVHRSLVQHANHNNFISILYGGSSIYKKRLIKRHYSE